MLVLISMTNWKKTAGLIVAPLAFGVMFSTIYLQYHYVVDMLAGVVLAVAVFYLGRLLADRYPLHNPVPGGNHES
jgi:membrane-associated phospholipid phosphatase